MSIIAKFHIAMKTIMRLIAILIMVTIGVPADVSGQPAPQADKAGQIEEHFARSYIPTLDERYASFQRRLKEARESGGIDVFGSTNKDGIRVGFFLMSRNDLSQALQHALLDKQNPPKPELVAEIQAAIAASEKEIPTPDDVEFGRNPPPRKPSFAQAAPEQDWKKRAEEALSLALRPVETKERGTGVPVIIRLKSKAEQSLYMNRKAISTGLMLKVTDSSGQQVPLNEKGQALGKLGAMPFSTAATPVMQRYSPEFTLDISDYAALQAGATYTIQAEWTFKIHERRGMPENLAEGWVHTVTLKSDPIHVMMHSKP